jgi:hypothetical protein
VPPPIHDAGYGRVELLKLLVEQPGADVTAANKQKQRPVDVARVNGEVRGAGWVRRLLLAVLLEVCAHTAPLPAWQLILLCVASAATAVQKRVVAYLEQFHADAEAAGEASGKPAAAEAFSSS